MRSIAIVLLLVAGCASSRGVPGQDPALLHTWHYTATEAGADDQPHAITFRKDGTVVFDEATMGYRAHPPYIICWYLEDDRYQAPMAMYYEINDGTLRLVTDVSILLYRPVETPMNVPREIEVDRRELEAP